ncbi:PilW family protein [Microbulbifer sp. TRSA002]|uniref:PilW family protein n=1 Tax=Microbulbifer sp. TRSA002 TaxID=3243382 RepID=UPI004039CCD8
MLKQRGISLVELMVSITVGLVLMAGVVQLFLSSKVTFTTQQAIARVQETGRLAIEFISEDIRMAGYVGCMNIASGGEIENLLNDNETTPYNFSQPAEGIDHDQVNANYPNHSGDSDVLLLRSARGTPVEVAEESWPDRVWVDDTGTEENGCDVGEDKFSGICLNDILIIADCTKAQVFQVTGFDRTTNNAVREIGLYHSDADGFTPGNIKGSGVFGASERNHKKYFTYDAQVFVATSTYYYIDNGTSGRPSLFREVNGESQELLAGVEQMQITYGLDTSANRDYVPDVYKPAKEIAVTDWKNLVSIRVELLISSDDDNVLQDTQLYSFNGEEDLNPGDKRLRQVFMSTVSIRSSMP